MYNININFKKEYVYTYVYRCMPLNLTEKSLHLYRKEQMLRMFWKFNYLSSDLDNLLDKEVSQVTV